MADQEIELYELRVTKYTVEAGKDKTTEINAWGHTKKEVLELFERGSKEAKDRVDN